MAFPQCCAAFKPCIVGGHDALTASLALPWRRLKLSQLYTAHATNLRFSVLLAESDIESYADALRSQDPAFTFPAELQSFTAPAEDAWQAKPLGRLGGAVQYEFARRIGERPQPLGIVLI